MGYKFLVRISCALFYRQKSSPESSKGTIQTFLFPVKLARQPFRAIMMILLGTYISAPASPVKIFEM